MMRQRTADMRNLGPASVQSRERCGDQVMEALVSLLKLRVEFFCRFEAARSYGLLYRRMYLTCQVL